MAQLVRNESFLFQNVVKSTFQRGDWKRTYPPRVFSAKWVVNSLFSLLSFFCSALLCIIGEYLSQFDKMWRNWLLSVYVLSGIGSLAIASESPLGYTSNGTCKLLTYGERAHLHNATSDS